ncbi:DUF58 domain-containing protein [Candidatus Woesearchaeota archaeon]|nr:DUF58 domain-containing protein [Candidatus Woesearchaeota archaeon]
MKSLKVDIDDVIRKTSAMSTELQITKKGSIGFTRQYESKELGSESIEFFDFREYTPQDNPKNIDWKASIRSGKMVIRQTIIEKDVEVIFAVGCGNSMLFGSVDKLKIENSVELTAALSHMLLHSGVSVGLILYSDKVKDFVKPSFGGHQFEDIRRTLMNYQAFGGETNINISIPIIHSVARPESVVIFISDFIKFNEREIDIIKKIGNRCKVAGIMVRDITDKNLPKGGYVIFEDPSEKEHLLINTSEINEEYERIATKQENIISEGFTAINAALYKIYTNKNIVDNIKDILSRNASV